MQLAKLEHSQDTAPTVTGILLLFHNDGKGSLPAFYTFSEAVVISKGQYQVKCKLQLKRNQLQSSRPVTSFYCQRKHSILNLNLQIFPDQTGCPCVGK